MFKSATCSINGASLSWNCDADSIESHLVGSVKRLAKTKGILVVTWPPGDSVAVEDFREGKLAVEVYREGIDGWVIDVTTALGLIGLVLEGEGPDVIAEFCASRGEPF